MKLLCTVTYFIFLIGTSVCWAQDSDEPVASDGPTYFPIGSVSEFEQTWYASHLSAMEEPILQADEDTEYFALRVLYLPTWGRPIAFRYELRNGTATRRAVILSGSGGYAPGTIRDEVSSDISSEDIAELLLALEDSGYWDLSDQDDVSGTDGSQLIIETVRSKEHRVFVRWTPEHEPSTRGLTKLVDFYKSEFTDFGFWGIN
ncbi:hypothetical protein QGM61_07660 [Pseudohongiella sp. SYSU M77423]|uniref:hypothetical protein n=1 Tax=Pseudohongiella sp. SYSU M77423 TaxID=3042312 RepID=UPI00247FCA30|nr:hypothetical protein [Pseudohongiella sp. SYSU M77423]MDH7943694.1 hypothetical protein [Pseudohongiella sp. SYSU M77423]